MKAFLLQTCTLALMRMMMDMVLPDGDTKRYVDLGAGLLLMMCMLDALGNVLPFR